MEKKDDNMKWLLENFDYIDSLTAIDDTGKIIVKKRYNPRYTDEENKSHNEWALNKNLLDVFPSLAMKTVLCSRLFPQAKWYTRNVRKRGITWQQGGYQNLTTLLFPEVTS